MKTLKTLKAELLADPATHAEYVSVASEFEMAREPVSYTHLTLPTNREE